MRPLSPPFVPTECLCWKFRRLLFVLSYRSNRGTTALTDQHIAFTANMKMVYCSSYRYPGSASPVIQHFRLSEQRAGAENAKYRYSTCIYSKNQRKVELNPNLMARKLHLPITFTGVDCFIDADEFMVFTSKSDISSHLTDCWCWNIRNVIALMDPMKQEQKRQKQTRFDGRKVALTIHTQMVDCSVGIEDVIV